MAYSAAELLACVRKRLAAIPLRQDHIRIRGLDQGRRNLNARLGFRVRAFPQRRLNMRAGQVADAG
jgi:hypothetical protein